MGREPQETFTVSIHGMALPDDVAGRINDAVQRAALSEIATLDLRGNELVFRPIMKGVLGQRDDEEGGGGGGTGGGAHIEIRTLDDEAPFA